MVTITMENGKQIKIELYPEIAPITVENFIKLVNQGFYNGLTFHRVIPGFMIQGGGFTPDMAQKPTKKPIKIESDNGLANMRGTIAMARTSDPNSATSQFFINTVDNAFLDFTAPTVRGYGYAVFGKVVAGFDVLDKISNVKTASHGFHQDVPEKVVAITSIRRA